MVAFGLIHSFVRRLRAPCLRRPRTCLPLPPSNTQLLSRLSPCGSWEGAPPSVAVVNVFSLRARDGFRSPLVDSTTVQCGGPAADAVASEKTSIARCVERKTSRGNFQTPRQTVAAQCIVVCQAVSGCCDKRLGPVLLLHVLPLAILRCAALLTPLLGFKARTGTGSSYHMAAAGPADGCADLPLADQPCAPSVVLRRCCLTRRLTAPTSTW